MSIETTRPINPYVYSNYNEAPMAKKIDNTKSLPYAVHTVDKIVDPQSRQPITNYIDGFLRP